MTPPSSGGAEALPSHFIDTQAALEAHAPRWRHADAVAIDTEFERSRTYFVRPALAQLCDGRAVYLLDLLALPRPGPLLRLLEDPGTVKIMHGPGEDREVFARLGVHEVTNLFDTQLAAALTGLDFGIGYAALVRQCLGVELSKDQTRSNWMARPLSPAQLEYAALDVRHLPALHALLRTRLERAGRLGWLAEETERAARAQRTRLDPEYAVQRFRDAARLPPAARLALRRLAAWRERQAMHEDRPRRRVVPDALLFETARRAARTAGGPVDPASLAATWPSEYRAAVSELLAAALRESAARPEEPAPGDPRQTPLFAATMQRLREVTHRRAAELGIAAELLASRRLLESLLLDHLSRRAPALPDAFQGWRRAVIADELQACLGSG